MTSKSKFIMQKIIILLFLCTLNSTLMNGQDQGITSSIHGANVGKIVFASSMNDIAFKKENPAKFKNVFRADEKIYARVYTAQSLANTTFDGNQEYAPGILLYNMYINGKQVGYKRSFGMHRHIPAAKKTYFTEQLEAVDAWFKWTSWKLFLLPDEKDPDLKYGNMNIAARSFVLALLDLDPGTHEIKIEVSCLSMTGEAQTEVVASGAFSLNLTAADKKKLAFAYAPPLPKDEWQGGNKEKLLAEIKEAFRKEIKKEPILVGISGSSWKEGSYTLTGQKYRKIAAWAVFPDGDGDGQVPITTFNWVSDYANGSWTKLRFDSHCLGCPDWDVEVVAVKAMAEN
jgi:hypothetical protein